MSVIILLDDRLRAPGHKAGGVAPKLASQKLITVGAATPITTAVADVKAAAAALTAPIDLYIMAHGRASSPGIPGGGQLNGLIGGTGLKLCKEELQLSNMSVVQPWSGLFRSIWLYACAAAYDESIPTQHQPGMQQQSTGRKFCGNLAMATGAEVIASDTVQKFDDTPAG